MKKILTLIAAISMASCSKMEIAPNTNADIKVSIENLSIRKGKIYAGLVNEPKNFNQQLFTQEGVLEGQNAEVPSIGGMKFTFNNQQKGNYAIVVFQDLNENGRLDHNNYTPTEPFGISNYEMINGTPTFEKARFEAQSDVNVNIKMIQF
jgi:uncharacterized protein (DUF2141 family)